MDLILIQSTMFAVVNVLDHRTVSEPGILQTSFNTPVMAVIPLMIDQEAYELVRCKLICTTLFKATGKSMMHAQ